MRIAIIPFSGFYNSIHDANLDDALNQVFSDDSGNPNDGLVSRAFGLIDWQRAQTEYAREYVGAFADEFEIKGLRFESLNSPREYNFTTDRIFVELPIGEVYRMRRVTPANVLARVAREMFTSRSGFSSFYSPDVTTWGPMREWDHNQLFALISAYVDHVRNDGLFDMWAEHSLMDRAQCNGYFDNWLFEGAKPELLRLDRIGQYLRQRDERHYRIGA